MKCDAASRAQAPPASAGGRPICSIRVGRGQIVGGAVGLVTLASMLQRDAGGPVIDRTGLEGLFDVDLEWSAAPSQPGASLFTAVQEQLGLKLEPIKLTEEFLIIEKAERPTPN